MRSKYHRSDPETLSGIFFGVSDGVSPTNDGISPANMSYQTLSAMGQFVAFWVTLAKLCVPIDRHLQIMGEVTTSPLNHVRWKRRYTDEASPNNMWFTSEVIPIFQTIWFCDVLRWKVGQQKIGASILWQVHVSGMIRRQPFKVIFKYFNYFQTRSLGSSSTIVCIPEVCEYTPFCC